MKMVMHLGHGQKKKCIPSICFLRGGGQEYGRIFDLLLGREEIIFHFFFSAIWAAMKPLELDSFVQKTGCTQMLRLASCSLSDPVVSFMVGPHINGTNIHGKHWGYFNPDIRGVITKTRRKSLVFGPTLTTLRGKAKGLEIKRRDAGWILTVRSSGFHQEIVSSNKGLKGLWGLIIKITFLTGVWH